jgi:hypothetical protein
MRDSSCGAAFKEYFGEEYKTLGQQYDACELAKNYDGPTLPHMLIDQARTSSSLSKAHRYL